MSKLYIFPSLWSDTWQVALIAVW